LDRVGFFDGDIFQKWIADPSAKIYTFFLSGLIPASFLFIRKCKRINKASDNLFDKIGDRPLSLLGQPLQFRKGGLRQLDEQSMRFSDPFQKSSNELPTAPHP
jgi:hypothetical protein